MSLYTLLLATVVNVNKELPVQGSLTLDDCTKAAMEALTQQYNYAKCRPTQPERPVVFVKLPSGVITEVERQPGGYKLSGEYTAADDAFVATALGRPSSLVHSRTHQSGPDHLRLEKSPESIAAE
ncbi:hypothetical protein N5D61_06785 [Pseudomonas sp. GD03842]|uniref:hypothetical protein n=1 Tax=unclassified Pseudomonas TaxID=196821 RepID=UPI000D335768|nr:MULTISPECIES: hypothetical protein [unclassified Pseudomonas]MDH0746046.1 hypothetical protein [Pseudomonas sp. GD03842]RAU48534.1 hypothetical protein DBP26_003185 [Pseudomonas sp. RIT 409]RAU54206.1 hypothetical protein DBY65_011880 [Pseudomonas sp. RIT 412]